MLAVDVEQEAVDGGDPLGETAFQVVPFWGSDDPRDEVEWEDTLAAFGFSVDVEGDALVEKREVLKVFPSGNLFGRHVSEGLE